MKGWSSTKSAASAALSSSSEASPAGSTQITTALGQTCRARAMKRGTSRRGARASFTIASTWVTLSVFSASSSEAAKKTDRSPRARTSCARSASLGETSSTVLTA